MDSATQRKNMVESQVRPSDVTDRRIIRAMQDIAREAFVPEAQRALAYMDGPIRLAAGTGPRRTLLAPRTLAKLLQLGDIGSSDAVLVAGAATGYGAAIAARCAASVVALECDAKLVEMARVALAETAKDVRVVTGALQDGVAEAGPYDVIVVEGGIAEAPKGLLDQLKDGGRLVAVLVEGGVGKAVVWRRSGASYGSLAQFDAAADVLPGFERAPAFAF